MSNENYREELNGKTDKQIKAIAKKHRIDTSLITEREELINMIVENQANNQADENAQPIDEKEKVENNDEAIIAVENPVEQENPQSISMSIPLDILDPSPLNFFHALRPKKYNEVKESIASLGLLQPIIVRPKEGGRYEILAGHNRVTICKDLGWSDITAIIKNVPDNEAEEIIADTNVAQRDDMTPLEIARAYEIKAKAIGNRRGQRTYSDTGIAVRDIIGKEYEITGRTVDRYLQLNNLIPEFKELLESEKIKTTVGFDLGLLDTATQKSIIKNIDMTNGNDIDKINMQNIGKIKKVLKEKNTLPLEEMKELKRQNKVPKHHSLTKDEVKSIIKEKPIQNTKSVKVDLPEDIDVDIMDILKNEPETVVRLLSEYIAALKGQQNENYNQ